MKRSQFARAWTNEPKGFFSGALIRQLDMTRWLPSERHPLTSGSERT